MLLPITDDTSNINMDVFYDVERDLLEMGREEMLSTFHGAMTDLLAEALNPLPPTSPPPPFPAGLELNSHPQPAGSQACVSEQQSPLTDVTALCSGLAEVEDMQKSQAASQGQVRYGAQVRDGYQ